MRYLEATGVWEGTLARWYKEATISREQIMRDQGDTTESSDPTEERDQEGALPKTFPWLQNLDETTPLPGFDLTF